MNESEKIENKINTYFESAQIEDEEKRTKLRDKIYGAIDYIDKVDAGSEEDTLKMQLAALNHKNNEEIKQVLLDVYEEQLPNTQTKSEETKKTTQPESNTNLTEEQIELITRKTLEKEKATETIQSITSNYNEEEKKIFEDAYSALTNGGKSPLEAINLANRMINKSNESIPDFSGTIPGIQAQKKTKLKPTTSEEKAIVEMFKNAGISEDKLLG